MTPLETKSRIKTFCCDILGLFFKMFNFNADFSETVSQDSVRNEFTEHFVHLFLPIFYTSVLNERNIWMESGLVTTSVRRRAEFCCSHSWTFSVNTPIRFVVRLKGQRVKPRQCGNVTSHRRLHPRRASFSSLTEIIHAVSLVVVQKLVASGYFQCFYIDFHLHLFMFLVLLSQFSQTHVSRFLTNEEPFTPIITSKGSGIFLCTCLSDLVSSNSP